MFITRTIFIVFLVLFSANVQAQPEKPRVPRKGEAINQVDAQGKRNGMWLNMIDASKGEAAYSEFGTYQHGQKFGPWYKLNKGGDLVAIENYRKDVFDGEVKYFTNGQVTVIGRYRGLNPDVAVDTIMVEDPVTELQQLVPIRSDYGTVRHGTWRYYNETNGMLTKVEEYQVDSLIYEEYFKYSKQDSLRHLQRLKNMGNPNMPRETRQTRKMHSYLNY